MCGIAGRVNLSAPVDRAEIFRMTERLSHRGPDDYGYHLRFQIGLGHRRLSIIDRAGGRQPLANEDERVWVVFNGEIYNHLSLRRELLARGHRFRTHSDTEAIVHAYEEWGPDCARRLRGMFAFAIWDDRDRSLTLARDRLGIKPLYYAALPSGDLLFGSEVKALTASADVEPALDEEALTAYLALRYVPAPLTLLSAVKKLPPATVLTWRAGRVSLRRYWNLAEVPVTDPTPPTEAEAACDLRDRIDEATRLRLMAEVPVGAFLSGGLDSTLVTAAMLAAPEARGALSTFSVGYAEDDTRSEDELEYARLAADALGTTHHEVRVSAPQAAQALPQIIWHLDEPVADPACVPLYFLAARARQEVTVVLSGEGADEALGGYYIYRKLQRLEALKGRFFGPTALAWLGALGRRAPHARLRRLAGLVGQPLERSYRGVSRGFDDELAARLHRSALGSHAAEALERVLAPHWEVTRGMTPLRRMLYLDSSVWLPDDLLVKADKMTMAHGLELRVPFLDHELMEHAWSLPDHLKVSRGVGKALLRTAARGRVPRAILERPKLGFGTPTAAWLRGGLRELCLAALTDTRSLIRERFDATLVKTLLCRHQAGADLSAELWPLLVLELWRKSLPVAAPPRPVAEVA